MVKENLNEMSSLYDLVNSSKQFSANAYGFGAQTAEKPNLPQTAMVLHEKTADKLLDEFKVTTYTEKVSDSYYGAVQKVISYESLGLVANHYQKAADFAKGLGLETKAHYLKKKAIQNYNKSNVKVKRELPASSAA